MSVFVIAPPAPLLDLVEVKRHLKFEPDYDREDALITAYLGAACAAIDGPEGWLGRAIGIQTLELQVDGFCGDVRDRIALPYFPVVSVESIVYRDGAGDEVTLDPATYELIGKRQLRPVFGQTWPSVDSNGDAVRIRYVAGFVADPAADPLELALPPAIRVAVLMMVANLYENRGEDADSGSVPPPMTSPAERLLAPFRALDI